MFDSKGMLTDRARGILFWITIGLVGIVGVLVVITIVQSCSRVMDQTTGGPAISPREVSLCTGQVQQFTADGEAVWEASGGTIGQDGLFRAPDTVGEVKIVASTGSFPRRSTEAVVRVTACTPVPTATPAVPTPTPTAVPSVASVTPVPVDPQGDVASYEGGAAADDFPPGVDLSAASPDTDLRIDESLYPEAPAGLAQWVAEGELLLWLSLFDPVPSPPSVFTDWSFALDVDGNLETGRSPGSARVNPDIGDDAVLGVTFNTATGDYEPYLLVWDADAEDLLPVAGDVRFFIDETRSIVGLAVSKDILTQAVNDASGVDLDAAKMRGRAAVLSYAGELPVIDFYPDRPSG
jgi:hypothetical protein